MREVNMDNVTYGKKMVNGKYEVDYEKWVDLSELPMHKVGKYKGKIDWQNSIGLDVSFKYKQIKGDIYINQYKKNKELLNIKYRDCIFNININNFKKVQFGNFLSENTSNFKFSIHQKFKNSKRDLTITDRKYIKNKSGQNCKYYKYKCNKCGFDCGEHYTNGEFKEEHWIVESNLKNGRGCACCRKSPQITVPHINSIVAKEETHWMIPYFQGGYDEAKMYTPSSNKSVYFKCPDCGEAKKSKMNINTLYSQKSISCKKCSDGMSYLSKYLHSGLIQLNLDFQTEVKYNWNRYINPLTNKESQARIDFVICYNNRKIPIEADGGFHRKNNSMSGQTKEMSQYIDKQRDENCLKYLGEETIRITDEGDIKENILNSKLSELFDLSKVDWNKCCEDARSSMIIKVCEYWNNKEEWETTKDLVGVFKIHRSTIIRCLNNGNANYDSKEEMKISASKNGKARGKKVEVFKDNISLGRFNNYSELERQSEELLGVKLNHSSIASVINGRRNTHKGFTFKSIEENQNIAS